MEFQMPSIKLKLPTFCKGCEIKILQSTSSSGQMLKIWPVSPDTDSLSPATAKTFKFQRQLDAFLWTSLIFLPKYSFCLDEKKTEKDKKQNQQNRKNTQKENTEQFKQTKNHLFL